MVIAKHKERAPSVKMELHKHIKLRFIPSPWKHSGVDCVERFHRKDLFSVYKSDVRMKYLLRP